MIKYSVFIVMIEEYMIVNVKGEQSSPHNILIIYYMANRTSPAIFLAIYKLSEKSSLNFLTSFSCQSDVASNLPKKTSV